MCHVPTISSSYSTRVVLLFIIKGAVPGTLKTTRKAKAEPVRIAPVRLSANDQYTNTGIRGLYTEDGKESAEPVRSTRGTREHERHESLRDSSLQFFTVRQLSTEKSGGQ